MLKIDQKGNISLGNSVTPLVLNNKSSAEINYQAFRTASTDYHNALYGYIEAENLKNKYASTQEKITYTRLNKNGEETEEYICLSEKN